MDFLPGDFSSGDKEKGGTTDYTDYTDFFLFLLCVPSRLFKKTAPGPRKNFSYTVKHRTMLHKGISHPQMTENQPPEGL
jgi:hypothetical protein